MADVYHILVGDDFHVVCGGDGEPACNEGDKQAILEAITEELHIDPRYTVEDDVYFALYDIFQAVLDRITALEE